MKNLKLLTIVGVMLMGVAGCIVTSINPLYTEKDLVFDPGLVGGWSESPDAKETWVFEKAGDKEYKLVITDSDGMTGQFQAHLLKLGDTVFLDCFPNPSGFEEWKQSGYYKLLFQPVHSFLKVSNLEPNLQMAPMNLKWLGKLVKDKPEAIRHERIDPDKEDSQIVLTASTKELQAFAVKHLKTPDAYGETIDLKRMKSKP